METEAVIATSVARDLMNLDFTTEVVGFGKRGFGRASVGSWAPITDSEDVRVGKTVEIGYPPRGGFFPERMNSTWSGRAGFRAKSPGVAQEEEFGFHCLKISTAAESTPGLRGIHPVVGWILPAGGWSLENPRSRPHRGIASLQRQNETIDQGLGHLTTSSRPKSLPLDSRVLGMVTVTNWSPPEGVPRETSAAVGGVMLSEVQAVRSEPYWNN